MSGTLEQRFREAIERNDFRKARFYLKSGVQTDKLLEDDIAVIHFLSGIDGKQANKLLKKCLENGASPNVLNAEGITPVHVAASWGRYDNLCTLLEFGGDVELRDIEGLSAIDHAKQSVETQAELCVKLLNDLVCKYSSKTVDEDVKWLQTENNACGFDVSNSYTPKDTIGQVRRTNCKELVITNDEENDKLWNTKNKQYSFTKVKSKLDVVAVQRKKESCDAESALPEDSFNINNPHKNFLDTVVNPWLPNQNGEYYIDGRDLMTEDESGSESLISENSPRRFYAGRYIGGREYMTKDESSLENCLSADSSSSSFHTANEGDISIVGASVLDDTVVSFPKLHPWTANQHTEMGLDDTIVGSISNLGIRDNSGRFESTCPYHSFLNNSVNNTISDGTVLYDWKEYSILEIPSSLDDTEVSSFAIPDTLLAMGCQKLREELLKLGNDPGPIRGDTRMLYVRRLARLQSGLTDTRPSDRLKEFLPEVRAVIEGRLPSPEMDDVEESLCVDFTKNDLKGKWREGTEKSSFNYLLLDPRVTQNLPLRSKKMAYEDIFHTFVAAVFYVGKGKRSRPYAHLHEALNLTKKNRKLQQIRDIWSSGLGIVSLHCFQGVIPVEAYTREACLVEALGLARLTNQKKCDYYGRAKKWSLKKKRQMGVSLIKRALQIFLNEGERQIRPEDLRRS